MPSANPYADDIATPSRAAAEVASGNPYADDIREKKQATLESTGRNAIAGFEYSTDDGSRLRSEPGRFGYRCDLQ